MDSKAFCLAISIVLINCVLLGNSVEYGSDSNFGRFFQKHSTYLKFLLESKEDYEDTCKATCNGTQETCKTEFYIDISLWKLKEKICNLDYEQCYVQCLVDKLAERIV